MNLMLLRMRPLVLRTLLRGVSVGLFGLLFALYVRVSPPSFLSALFPGLPTLGSVMLTILYLYSALYAALCGAVSLHPERAERERLYALPLSRIQIACSLVGARLLLLALFALCAAALCALGVMRSSGASYPAVLIDQYALHFPALLCAFSIGAAFSGLCKRTDMAAFCAAAAVLLLCGVAFLAQQGMLPLWLQYVSPLRAFSDSSPLAAEGIWLALTAPCFAVSLMGFMRRDLL